MTTHDKIAELNDFISCRYAEEWETVKEAVNNCLANLRNELRSEQRALLEEMEFRLGDMEHALSLVAGDARYDNERHAESIRARRREIHAFYQDYFMLYDVVNAHK